MDPVSQGVLGAAAAQTLSNRLGTRLSTERTEKRTENRVKPNISETNRLLLAALVGGFAAMAPDADVLIYSTTDPLLFLEYHRQFTHSLAFIPIGAAICSLLALVFTRSILSLRQTYLLCLAGYATHALLDACTSYGTMLFWPFSDARISWNNVSVIDPLFTLPALVAVILSVLKRRTLFAWIGLAWMLAYLLLGVIQRDRALDAGAQLAQQRGHVPSRLEVKPSFANLLLWKLVYEHKGYYYIDAIRVGVKVINITGERAAKLDLSTHFSWLAPGSQQARDIERFRWFSDDFLAIDQYETNGIVDVRYSLLPNEVRGMWGIRLDPTATDGQHSVFYVNRDFRGPRTKRFLNMLFNK
jgi:inner membrane protein